MNDAGWLAPGRRQVVFGSVRASLAVFLLLGGAYAPVAGQGRPPVDRVAEKAKADPAAAARAVAAWLDAKTRQDKLQEAAAKATLDAGGEAFAALKKHLDRMRPDGEPAERERAYRLRSLLRKVGVDFIHRALDSKMVFAGQYDALRALQPHIGQFYLGLLLDTPEWFPDDERVVLIPALRDLYPKSPGDDVLERLDEIASDVDFEIEALRVQLGYALAQWGNREYVAGRLEALREAVARERGEDRLRALRELADLHYSLRDYLKASSRHVELLRFAEGNGLRLVPSDYYNAACNLSLSGDLVRSLEELERCVTLMKSGTVDPSTDIDRSLFASDPDIRDVRRMPQFAKLMKRAFPAKPDKSDDPPGDTDKANQFSR